MGPTLATEKSRKDGGNYPNGCAIYSPAPRHPRSPKARYREHPPRDRDCLKTGATRLLKTRQERINDSIDVLNQIMQGWKHRFSPPRPQFGDRFSSAYQNIIIHFRTSKDSAELWAAEFIKKALPYPSIMAEHESLDGGEQLMFIDVVKLIQPKKGFVPTFVRLQRIDQFYSVRADELYYSLPGLFVTGRIIANREKDFPLFFDRDTGTMGFRKLIGKMVQCPPQVNHNVTSRSESKEAEVEHMDLPWWAISRMNVNVDARNITVSLKNPLHITEILFGPLNLRPH